MSFNKEKEMIIIEDLERTIISNEKLIYKLASKFNNNVEDLFQVGVIGLINAYNNYNSSYNVKFTTYAYPFILGEMKKYIRENKGVKISRELLYLSSRLDRLIELLTQKYRRIPNVTEISRELKIDESKIIEALEIRGCVKSIDDVISNDNKEITFLDVIASNDSIEDKIEFMDLVNTLDENEKKFIVNRYFNDKSQAELASIYGVSQAKISRLEDKILKKMKNYCKTTL